MLKAVGYYLRVRLAYDWEMVWYLLKKKRYRKLRSFLWTRFVVRDVGGGFRDFIYRWFPALAPFPKEVEVEITTRCHLRCIICENTHWKDPQYRKQDLSFDDFARICGQFPDLRCINVTGEGTCWLNKDFVKMLQFVDQKGAYTLFVESFDLFDEDRIKQVIPLDVARIEVSLDAARKETYERIKVGANWDRTIANLRKLREYKLKFKTPFPLLFFRYVVTTLNLAEIPDYVDLVADLDMNLGHSSDIQFAGLLSFDEIKHLDVPEIPDSIIKETERRAAKRGNVWVGWSHTKNNILPMSTCAKWLQPYIMIGGEVLLDCAVLMANNREFLKRNSFGNLYQTDLRTIWNSERYRRARTSVNRLAGPIHIYCKDCRGVDTSCRQQRYGVFDER